MAATLTTTGLRWGQRSACPGEEHPGRGRSFTTMQPTARQPRQRDADTKGVVSWRNDGDPGLRTSRVGRSRSRVTDFGIVATADAPAKRHWSNRVTTPTEPAMPQAVGVRILVVEDDAMLREALCDGLHQRGFTVDGAPDGEIALSKANLRPYDVVVLDRDLPGISGDEVLQRLHASGSRARCLMLTAASALDDLTAGLDLGADDYLTKPFRFPELAARIRALIRRTAGPAESVLTAGDLTLDPGRGRVERGGLEITLTHREFAVLELLLRARGELVSAEQLLERVWDENADPFTTAVKTIMSRLRKKLGGPPLIETVVGRGYRI